MFKYDLNGCLIGFELNAQLNQIQYDSTLSALPIKEQTLLLWTKSPGVKVVEVPLDLSFATFWTKYAYKVGDKKKAEKLWIKLNDADKTLALINIEKYNRFVFERGIDKVYPERYLSQERFKNEFR